MSHGWESIRKRVTGLVTQKIGLHHRILDAERGAQIVSVHRTMSTAVLQHFAAAHTRTTLAEPAGSGYVSCAFTASPDVATANRECCVVSCDFSVSGRETYSQSGPHPYRHRNDDSDYERCASGHVAGVMKPCADAGRSGQFEARWSRDIWKARMKSRSLDIPKYVLWRNRGGGANRR